MIELYPRLPRLEFWALAMPLAFIPILVQLAAAVTNDDLAFLGGAVATLGAWQAVTTGRGFWLAAALGGVVIAGWAKMTGLVLTGTMVGGVIVYLLWRRRLALRWIAVAAVAFAAAAAPYVIFIAQYGAPVPMTPALTAFVEQGLRDYGWADLPRELLPAYFGYFVSQFVANWMPTAASAPHVPVRDAGDPGRRPGLRRGRHRALAAPAVAQPRDRARHRRHRRRPGTRRQFRAALRLQLQILRRHRMAGGRVSALLPAARRHRAPRGTSRSRRASARAAGAPACWCSSSPDLSCFVSSASRPLRQRPRRTGWTARLPRRKPLTFRSRS